MSLKARSWEPGAEAYVDSLLLGQGFCVAEQLTVIYWKSALNLGVWWGGGGLLGVGHGES